MECDLIELAKAKQLTIETLRSMLQPVGEVISLDRFEVSIARCGKCGRFFIYCFREVIGLDIDDYWTFWIPVDAVELPEVRTEQVLFQYMGEMIRERSHIVMDPDGKIEWNEGGSILGFIHFFPRRPEPVQGESSELE